MVRLEGLQNLGRCVMMPLFVAKSGNIFTLLLCKVQFILYCTVVKSYLFLKSVLDGINPSYTLITDLCDLLQTCYTD